MANFTKYLKDVLEDGIDIGLKDYPIWDEAYRETLNNKIIQHYLYQEIALETDELFVHFLNLSMNENMPYFNNMYKSIVGIEDAFKNIDIESANKSASSSLSKGGGGQTSYLYPQTKRIEGEDYATTGADTTQESSADGVNAGVSKTEGLQGLTKAQAAEYWRSQLFDIDMLVIESLNINFMELYEFYDNMWL